MHKTVLFSLVDVKLPNSQSSFFLPSFADKQVILRADPSSKGPIVEPTLIPLSLRMVGLLGGTEKKLKNKKILTVQFHI